MMDNKCSNCEFSAPIRAPADERPELHKAPKETLWQWIKRFPLADNRLRDSEGRIYRWEQRKFKSEHEVTCKRYPEPSEKMKSYGCGEFILKKNGHHEQQRPHQVGSKARRYYPDQGTRSAPPVNLRLIGQTNYE